MRHRKLVISSSAMKLDSATRSTRAKAKGRGFIPLHDPYADLGSVIASSTSKDPYRRIHG